jgi:hypothetical protein
MDQAESSFGAMVQRPAEVYRSSQLQYVSGLRRRCAGFGIAPILALLLVVFLVAAIIKMMQKKN